MKFHELVRQIDEPIAALDIPEEWAQGRATFGGLVAALVYQAMQHRINDERLLRNLSITFVAPVKPGHFDVSTEILREGSNVTIVAGRGIQDGEVKLVLNGSFGIPRESGINAEGMVMKDVPDFKECEKLPFIPGVTPNFTQFFDFLYAYGGLPFSGRRSRELGGWISFSENEPEIGIAQILAMIDAWPPATLPWASRPVPASTLTWNIQFVQPPPALDVGSPCLYQAYVEEAAQGYGYTHSKLWTAAGELIALSQQTVTVFD